jgi:hypothetical protein
VVKSAASAPFVKAVDVVVVFLKEACESCGSRPQRPHPRLDNPRHSPFRDRCGYELPTPKGGPAW